MQVPYEEPGVEKNAFNCPFCGAYAAVHWSLVYALVGNGYSGTGDKTAMCTRCHRWSYWVRKLFVSDEGRVETIMMVHPAIVTAPKPSADLPADCLGDFEEAREVEAISPRGSAALLRLCIQKLCKHFGGKGSDINDDIALLVKEGLDERVKKALDIVRVTGNHAVHPGQMDLNDKPEAVSSLFRLVNMIVDQMITKPNELASMFEQLPDGAREQIERRDRETKPEAGSTGGTNHE